MHFKDMTITKFSLELGAKFSFNDTETPSDSKWSMSHAGETTFWSLFFCRQVEDSHRRRPGVNPTKENLSQISCRYITSSWTITKDNVTYIEVTYRLRIWDRA